MSLNIDQLKGMMATPGLSGRIAINDQGENAQVEKTGIGHFFKTLFGFKSAMDYYLAANATREIPFIRHPVYLLNALDDPFCSPQCHPFEQASKSSCFWFEAPRHGGHVGFVALQEDYYSEQRAVRFIRERSGIFG